MGRSGAVARQRLLDTAERHFAEHGVAGASLRDIAADAGQRNNSAPQYHFGDRAGLVAAVFARRMGPINARRRTLLADRTGPDRTGDLGAHVEALVVPLAHEVCRAPGWYGRFLERCYADPAAAALVAGLPEAAPLRALQARLASRLAPLGPVVCRSRAEQLQSHVLTTLARWEWAGDRGQRRLTVGRLTTELVATGTALLGAPPPGGRTFRVRLATD